MTGNQFLWTLLQVADGELADATVHLIKEPLTPTPGIEVADLEAIEADYTGYAAVTVDPVGEAWIDEDGNGVLSFQGAHFQPTTPTTVGNTIYGWWLEGLTGSTFEGLVVAVAILSEPIGLESALDALDITPTAKIGPVLSTS